MRDNFSTYHPGINFYYFSAVFLFSMFFMHPVFLGISLGCGVIYSIYLKGKKAVKFNLFAMLPLLVLTALVNPAFNHEGVTILLYVNDNPLTLESIVYGIAAAAMLISVLIWFSCYHEIMTSDKFIYLFGRIIPALSLVISMALRFVPRLKAQIKVISDAQRGIGRDISTGNLLQRAGNGIRILSILTTWALENAIETADSMRSRGYGLKGRTSFSNYRFDKRDAGMLALMFTLTLVIVAGAVLGENNIKYFPGLIMKERTIFSYIVYFCDALLFLLPVLTNIREDIRWKRRSHRFFSHKERGREEAGEKNGESQWEGETFRDLL